MFDDSVPARKRAVSLQWQGVVSQDVSAASQEHEKGGPHVGQRSERELRGIRPAFPRSVGRRGSTYDVERTTIDSEHDHVTHGDTVSGIPAVMKEGVLVVGCPMQLNTDTILSRLLEHI